MKKIISLFLLFLLLSCGLVAKKIYKIKKPKNENATSIKSFLIKKKIDTSNVYVFQSLESMKEFTNLESLNIPGALFFNKSGNFIEYNKSATTCTKNITSFLVDLKSFSSSEVKDDLKTDDVLKLIRPITKINNSQADIDVFILWTIFIGKLNDENTFEWIKLMKKAKSEGLKINYYLLNCDIQKEWNIEKSQSAKVKIK